MLSIMDSERIRLRQLDVQGLLGMLNIMDSELENYVWNEQERLLGMLNIMDSEQIWKKETLF